jgi:ribosomal protein S18 acetylase RimI-like enzyme
MLQVEVRELRRDELGFGAGVASRGLRDNPMTVAVLGEPALRRERMTTRTYGSFLKHMKHPPLAAWRDGYVVGVAGMAPPGTCQLSPMEVVRMLPATRPTRLRDLTRTAHWLGEWEKKDPDRPHWHLGPVAVEGGMRGMGIGSRLMAAFVERMDGLGEAAYLETDKPENVRFYERFGFEVIDEELVLDTRNWFMLREPVAGGVSPS